jgi:hypothetical protein
VQPSVAASVTKPDDDGQEDHRRDDHLDQLDKASPSGFICSPMSGRKWPSSTPIAIATSTWT